MSWFRPQRDPANTDIIPIATLSIQVVTFERVGMDKTSQRVMQSRVEGLPSEMVELAHNSVQMFAKTCPTADEREFVAADVYEVGS